MCNDIPGCVEEWHIPGKTTSALPIANTDPRRKEREGKEVENINTCMNITLLYQSLFHHPPPHLHRPLQSDHSLQFHLLSLRIHVQALDVIKTLLEIGAGPETRGWT